MSNSSPAIHLSTITDQAKSLGLCVRLAAPGDLSVIACEPTTKEHLGRIVTLATQLGLRVKWLNEGTLVAIGIPTKKPPVQNGQEVSQENPESRP